MQLNDDNQDPHISLLEFLRIVKKYWNKITIAGMAGLGISSIYLWIAPVQYEVTTSIIPAKIIIEINKEPDNFFDPKLLIYSMKKAGAFDDIDLVDCMPKISKGKIYQVDDFIMISKTITFLLFIQGSVPNAAEACANNILSKINAYERKIFLNLQEKHGANIINIQGRINNLEKINKSINISYAYRLLTLDAIEKLLEKLQLAQNLKVSNENFIPSRFSEPINEIRKPSSFKMLISLIAGFLGGASIAILFLFSKYMINLIKQNLMVSQ